MAGICPAVLSCTDGMSGRDSKVQKGKDNVIQVTSLTLASSNTDFVFSLYNELVLKNPDKNIVFSLFSISTALALLFLGAKSNTLKEILEGLKFNLTMSPEPDIHQGFRHLLHMLSHPGDQVQISTGSAMIISKLLQIPARGRQGLCTRLRPSQQTSSSLWRPKSSSMTM